MARPEFGHRRFDGDIGQFANDIESWLHTLLSRGSMNVFVEAPITGGKKTNLSTTMRLIGAQVILRKVAHVLGFRVTAVSVSAWRTHFMGCCRAPKEIVGASRRRKWLKDAAIAECGRRGWRVKSDDAADALGLLSYALDLENLGLTASQEWPLAA